MLTHNPQLNFIKSTPCDLHVTYVNVATLWLMCAPDAGPIAGIKDLRRSLSTIQRKGKQKSGTGKASADTGKKSEDAPACDMHVTNM